MPSTNHLIWLFIDGLGLAPDGLNNPLSDPKIKDLNNLLKTAKPIDAIMGVPGIPQSATGQTSLFCGLNAQKIIGCHVEGYPTKKLREIIKTENIYLKIAQRGLTSTFANGYWIDSSLVLPDDRKSHASVSTVAAASGLGDVRRKDKIRSGDAVYQDLTQESILARGGDAEIISPTEAAKRLLKISRGFNLTIFEYFQTDKAGHSQDFERANKVLTNLQEFVMHLADSIPDTTTLFITSDHGNIEDLSTPSHTLNPVPFIAIGKGASEAISRVDNLADISGVTLMS